MGNYSKCTERRLWGFVGFLKPYISSFEFCFPFSPSFGYEIKKKKYVIWDFRVYVAF